MYVYIMIYLFYYEFRATCFSVEESTEPAESHL